jgi:hypothetical protein
MDEATTKEKNLFRIQKLGKIMFVLTLLSGLGMVAYGMFSGIVLYSSYGTNIAITSPMFLAAYLVSKAKLKKLGIN